MALTSKFSSHSFKAKALGGTVSCQIFNNKKMEKDPFSSLNIAAKALQMLMLLSTQVANEVPNRIDDFLESTKQKTIQTKVFLSDIDPPMVFWCLGKFAKLLRQRHKKSRFNLEWPPANPKNPTSSLVARATSITVRPFSSLVA